MILASAILALGLVAAEDVTVSTNKVWSENIFEKILWKYLIFEIFVNICVFMVPSRGKYKENEWTMSLASITTPSRESPTLSHRWRIWDSRFERIERIIFPVYNTPQHQAPVEADTWTETLQTVEDGNLCPQYDISQSEPIGNTESNIFSASVLYPISRPNLAMIPS